MRSKNNCCQYKIGDIIGQYTMDGLYLLEITDIYNMMSGEICLSVKVLKDEKLSKPLSIITKSIVLPQQRYEIRTKEEYFEYIQNEINRKQNMLNKLKEQYETQTI